MYPLIPQTGQSIHSTVLTTPLFFFLASCHYRRGGQRKYFLFCSYWTTDSYSPQCINSILFFISVMKNWIIWAKKIQFSILADYTHSRHSSSYSFCCHTWLSAAHRDWVTNRKRKTLCCNGNTLIVDVVQDTNIRFNASECVISVD